MCQTVFAIDYNRGTDGKVMYRGVVIGIHGETTAQVSSVQENESAPSLLLAVKDVYKTWMGKSFDPNSKVTVRLKDKEVGIVLSVLSGAAAAKTIISHITN